MANSSKYLNGEVQLGPFSSRERSALDVLLRCFGYETGAETGMVLARNGASETRVQAIWGLAGAEPRASWTANSLIGRAFDATDVGFESPLEAPSTNGSTAPQASSFGVAAPIVGATRSLGVLYASFTEEPSLGAERLRWVAESYARLAALCMDGSQGLAATLMASSVDRLTGCLSRDALLEALGVEIDRAERRGSVLSCCFLDLDEFKMINDALGHLEGNRVLAAVGEELRSATRPYDTVGRFGGDEFVVILPETTGRGAHLIAERIRVRVAAAVARTARFPTSASAGVAEWASQGSARNLLEAADEALADAKRGGGGKVVSRSPLDRRNDGLVELTRTLVRGRGRSRNGIADPVEP
ncbi:MAG: hypothetical protein QOJ01_2376 [Solirubrobacterales bacterium]|nr:hypothetical protein [Solirubrobacterales bacterium]